jgi:hypothetical protein
MACFEGVSLRLTGIPDTTRYRVTSVDLAYGDTVEASSAEWEFFRPGAFNFTSPRIRSQRPAHVQIQIKYTELGVPELIKLDTSLTWHSSVCNQCSGNSSDCKDQMSPSAVMDVNLGL